MKLDEFRNYFEQIDTGETFYARPIFNNEFMGRLGELFGEAKYDKFKTLIDNDDIIGLKDFLKKNYRITEKSSKHRFYTQKVYIEFDIILNEKPDFERPYYLGFHSNSIPLHKVIEILQVYFDNDKSNFWLTGEIITNNTRHAIDDLPFYISGNLMFVASPISEKTVTLHILKETTDIKSKAELNALLINHYDDYYDKLYHDNMPLTEKDIPISAKGIKCYNIGQGNCIEIIGDAYNVPIFFDVGLTKYKTERNQNEIIKSINNLKERTPSIIILSHWDTDHILGLSLWGQEIYNGKWIVPDLHSLWYKKKNNSNNNPQERKTKQVSSYAFRIFLKLIQVKTNQVYIISEDLKQTCIYKKNSNNTSAIEIWTGIRKNSGSKNTHIINRANNFGLIMMLHGSYQNAILCGDCDYSVIPKSLIEKDYGCVVVSHHGSKMSSFPFKPQSNSDSVAIISYGLSNTFGHPDESKIAEISNNGYQIIPTIRFSEYQVDIQFKDRTRIQGI
ncbi:hypothetical protein [Selenomonas sp. FC4001]|uniref:hypothetical protein n=1 Tax=Selenomonas sp. FC4001 TaxID=1408313 RepID=UPI00055C7283|nr:hypothetical protein [Selenomonas sp. FC4001]